MSQQRRVSSEGAKGAGKSRRWKKDTANLFKDGLNWDKYLQICNLPAAPQECFKQNLEDEPSNDFQIGQKLEAQDPRNPTSICLATVVSLQGPRLLLRLDGGDKCNDFWRLVDSGDIYPLGTHESKGVLLQPPLGYTRNVSTWTSFLAKNRIKGDKAPDTCFRGEPVSPDKNRFEIGMKLEAVDKKNADLICPATVGDVNNEQIFVSFDGWRGAMDYWCHYTSRDLFPVGWCEENDHPLSSPGAKGDNPSVVARLRKIAEESKRRTRSGASADSTNLKSLDEPPIIKAPEQVSPAGTSRSRVKGRVTRSLTPIPKRVVDSDATSSSTTSEQPSKEPTKDVVSTAGSSAEDDTFDSSLSSSQHSSESSDEEEPTPPESMDVGEEDVIEKMKNKDDIEEAEMSKPDPIGLTAREKRLLKLERKMRKKRKKDKMRMKKNLLKYAGSASDAQLERKRYASTGDEELSRLRLKKRKKKKRKHSTSSLYDSSPRKRMLGFGNPPTTICVSTSAQGSRLLSPSFLDHAKSPTSLFGFSREEIVKKATAGWPTRLLGGSEMVVTSDNKLARFGNATVTNSACQTTEEAETPESKPEPEKVIQGQVTTTTNVGEANDETATPQSSNTTQNTEAPKDTGTSSKPDVKTLKVSSQTVSSTTSSKPPTPVNGNVAAPATKEQNPTPNPPVVRPKIEPETSPEPRRMSRNPQRWTVSDVITYIKRNEPALASHIQLFQIHEIDGQALLLLNSSIAVKYMNMRLGPALKLANLVERLKEMVPPPL